jgi:hypothetical protein
MEVNSITHIAQLSLRNYMKTKGSMVCQWNEHHSGQNLRFQVPYGDVNSKPRKISTQQFSSKQKKNTRAQ